MYLSNEITSSENYVDEFELVRIILCITIDNSLRNLTKDLVKNYTDNQGKK